MFHFLNRMAKWAGILVVLAGLFLLYQYRAIFDPLVDWGVAMRHHEWGGEAILGRISGTGVRVLNGDTFLMRDENRRGYNVRLTGLLPALSPQDPRGKLPEWEIDRFETLKNFIVSNRVDVLLTYTNASGGALGVAVVGGTNVSTELLRNGLAKTEPKRIRNLPLGVEYRMLAAQRHAQKAGLGVWKGKTDAQFAGVESSSDGRAD